MNRENLEIKLRQFMDEARTLGYFSEGKDQKLNIEGMCALGLIPKHELKDGVYYYGKCRNASVAQWDASRGVFVYMRTKFGSSFSETICHPSDDDGYDLFFPIDECFPLDREKIVP